jgi:hypothetical protein
VLRANPAPYSGNKLWRGRRSVLRSQGSAGGKIRLPSSKGSRRVMFRKNRNDSLASCADRGMLRVHVLEAALHREAKIAALKERQLRKLCDELQAIRRIGSVTPRLVTSEGWFRQLYRLLLRKAS